MSPFEKFYEGLDREQSGLKGLAGSVQDNLFRSEDERARKAEEEGRVPSEIKESEDLLRGKLGNRRTIAEDPAANPLLEFFGLRTGGSDATDNSRRKENDFVEQYRQMMNTPLPPPNNRLVEAALEGNAPRSPAPKLNGLETYRPPKPAANVQLGVISPVYNPDTRENLNSKVVNAWNPLYTMPKIEPPRVTPPKPNFEAPRRKF